jgi:hypothetical protein
MKESHQGGQDKHDHFYDLVDLLVQIPGPDLAIIILLPIGDIYWE